MKISIRKMLVLLAIVLSVISIQSVWAGCDVTVSGEVTAIDSASGSIDVTDVSDTTVTVYGIPFSYLANKLKINIAVDDFVVITASVCPVSGDLSACTLNGNTLPGNRNR
jgi:hypothetical protein